MLTGILEGLPRGLAIDPDFINLQLHRRQLGYGRGARMRIELDQLVITSGVRQGSTLGALYPSKWKQGLGSLAGGHVDRAAPEGANLRKVTRPRPGHADLAAR